MKHQHQTGSSLIEVLVAVLLLSFGMLSLGAMLSFAVQAPKLSGYRATAANLASSHVERIRANPDGFASNAYTTPLSYDGTSANLSLSDCTYYGSPPCTAATLATMDNAFIKQAARNQLPAGGMILWCNAAAVSTKVTCTRQTQGNLWIVWQEPGTLATLDPTASDLCPAEVTTGSFDPAPRCLYVKFKIE